MEIVLVAVLAFVGGLIWRVGDTLARINRNLEQIESTLRANR